MYILVPATDLMRGWKLRSVVVGRNMRESTVFSMGRGVMGPTGEWYGALHSAAWANSLPIPVPDERLDVEDRGGGQEYEREHSLQHGESYEAHRRMVHSTWLHGPSVYQYWYRT